jgi:putative NIF3 family GTP cyclohydrolase 1 type 2
VDRIILGSADTEVKGIATTMMATFDALKDAAKAGLNLVFTHESTFWSHPDTLTELMDDPLYKAKADFMRAHNMVSYHLHDHWHALRPVDGINFGMAQQMGWTSYMDPSNQRMFTLPQTTLLELAREFERKLDVRTVRVVGDPALPVRRVYESWGNTNSMQVVGPMDTDTDVLVDGEAQDWDVVEYVEDLVSSGQKKALVLLGHVKSEQWGMQYCAEWLKGFVTEVPVRFVEIVEPYWMVDRPVMEINTNI